MALDDWYRLFYYSYYLKNGIDPTTEMAFPEDTILNLASIREYNADVNEMVGTIIREYQMDKRKTDKLSFFLTVEQKENFPYSETPVSISDICAKLNANKVSWMKKLCASDVVKGLCRLGFLRLQEIDGVMYKVPSDLGEELGITRVEKINGYGNKYAVNVYNLQAQKHVIDNLALIMKACKIRQE